MSTDNSDPVAKILLRQWLLDECGGAENTAVLELFGGMGHIYDACYAKPQVKKHMAFELRKVNRPTWLQGDNRTLLKNNVQGWDLYDLDAYASPWTLANDICRMRDDGVFAMALTCGIYRSLNTGHANGFIRQRIGLNGIANETGLVTRWYPNIIEWLMLDWERWGVTVKKAKHIGSVGSHLIHYFGVIVEKDSSKATEKPSAMPQAVVKKGLALPVPPSKKTVMKAKAKHPH